MFNLQKIKKKEDIYESEPETWEWIEFHFCKTIELVLLLGKQLKRANPMHILDEGPRKISIGENIEGDMPVPILMGSQIGTLKNKADKGQSFRDLQASMRSLDHEDDEPGLDVMEQRRNLYKTLLEDITNVDLDLWTKEIGKHYLPRKLKVFEHPKIFLLELEITYPNKTIDDLIDMAAPCLRIYNHSFTLKKTNKSTWLDLFWLEKKNNLMGALSPPVENRLAAKKCWVKVIGEITMLINSPGGAGGIGAWDKSEKNSQQYLEHVYGDYYTEYLKIDKKRQFLPYSGFRAFEINHWYVERNSDNVVNLMRGFIGKQDPKKDIKSFLQAKAYSKVIFFPHSDTKMRKNKKKKHNNLLMLDNSCSFIKEIEGSGFGDLPTMFIFCAGQKSRLSLLWQFLTIHLKSNTSNEIKDIVLKAIDGFFKEWGVLNIKNFARDIFTLDELRRFSSFVVFDRELRSKNLSKVLRRTLNLTKLSVRYWELERLSRSYIDDLID